MTSEAYVRFRTPLGVCGLPVRSVLEVVDASGLQPLLESATGVAGMLAHGDHVVPVLSTLAQSGAHILVVAGDVVFGLLSEQVLGVVRVADADVSAAPLGQAEPLITGVIVAHNGESTMLLDPHALSGRLAQR